MEKQDTLQRTIFWNRNSKPINVINPDDFWKDELLSKLGLEDMPLVHSMGSSERNEVVERQNTMKLLHENPELRKFVRDGVNTKIPTNGQDFLNEFSPEKPMSSFMEGVARLIALLSKINANTPLAGRIAKFFSSLNNTFEEAKNAERKFGEVMGKEIEKASMLHGRTTFIVSGSSATDVINSVKPVNMEEEGYGYRHFSFKLSMNYKIILNSSSRFWMKKENRFGFNLLVILSTIFFPVGIYILIHNRRLRKMAFKPMIIEEVPNQVKEDICSFLKEMLINNPKKVHDEAMQKQKNKKVRNLPEIPSFKGCSPGITYVEVYYQYEADGLHVRILRVYSKVDTGKKHYSPPRYDSGFFGYSTRYINKISRSGNKLADDATLQVNCYDRTYTLLNYFQKLSPELFNEDVQIPSNSTDHEFKYYTIQEANDLPHIFNYFRIVTEYRNSFSSSLEELRMMTNLLEKVIHCSDEWGIPIEYPTILPDGEHVIGFETIYPIHLIGREAPDGSKVEASDLVPINSLPPLNGQIVGLTGQNGGGKTATLNELTYLLYLAQSGLPVFGEGVKLNVKTTIGLVFNTRGEGSQLQNFLIKTKNVFEAIKKTPSNATVVLLDELGSGAQHEDGIALGKEILKTLHSSGASTIYNTQLSEIADYSEKELGAICFKFTLDHQVRKGIGSGNATALAKQMGIDMFFIRN